jgi:hypothetical protein
MRATLQRVAVLGLAVMLAVSCGGNPTSKVTPLSSCVASIKPAFAYVLNGLSTDTVSMFTVNSCTGDSRNTRCRAIGGFKRNQLIDGQSDTGPSGKSLQRNLSPHFHPLAQTPPLMLY